jgi:hypothetical protein
MTDLLATVLAAHGGLQRWNELSSMSARVRRNGVIWSVKGRTGFIADARVTVGLREAWVLQAPFGSAGGTASFTPDRVVIRRADGSIVEDLTDPRASFRGHGLDTPWSDAQLVYTAGCAMWTYFNMPFLLAYPGVRTRELEPSTDGPVTLHRLEASFPEHYPVLGREQVVHVDPDGHVVRHDYAAETVGGALAAHFASDYVEVSGIVVPTKRRLFARQPDGRVIPEPVVASFDLSDLELR